MVSPDRDPQYDDDCTLTPSRRAEHRRNLDRYGECGRCGVVLPDHAPSERRDPNLCYFCDSPTEQPFQWIWVPAAEHYLRERVCEADLPRLAARGQEAR